MRFDFCRKQFLIPAVSRVARAISYRKQRRSVWLLPISKLKLGGIVRYSELVLSTDNKSSEIRNSRRQVEDRVAISFDVPPAIRASKQNCSVIQDIQVENWIV